MPAPPSGIPPASLARDAPKRLNAIALHRLALAFCRCARLGKWLDLRENGGMNYPGDLEGKLGFDQVRGLVGERCLSALGRERVGAMVYSSDCGRIRAELGRTAEFVRVLGGKGEFPCAYIFDVRGSLGRLRAEGSFVEESALFDLLRSLRTLGDVVRYFAGSSGDGVFYPALSSLAGGVQVFPELIARLEAVMDVSGEMRDSASPALMEIRQSIVGVRSGISRSLQGILRAAQSEGLVEREAAPVLRDGRLMLPVSPSFKRRLRGIVHDESSSGKTVFIEPEAVVEGNNRIRELEVEERRERVRILVGVADAIRPCIVDLLASWEFLGEIDFIRAKALFAVEIGGICPRLSDKPQMEWQGAVHPLLLLSCRKQGKEVQPLDIELTDDRRILVISGPNAGGKSVCLKTVGLLQYMLQCGLLVPLHERSQTGIFSGIFMDIGDEQSIENDLSTYSSHLLNMKYFVRHCNGRTLLLIDEFGSGTEPQIGGAIAESLLDRFNRKGAYAVITTHYHNLKRFAERTAGIVNGAMLYDRHLMQPLYQLAIGNPGSSFAVEIARHIGLPADVIADASDKVGADYIQTDKYLQDIVRDKRYWAIKRDNIRRQEKQLEALISRYEQKLEAIEKQRKDILRTAKETAERLLSDANAQIESTIRAIKEAQAAKEQTRQARRALDDFKAGVLRAEENDAPIAPAIVQPPRRRKGQTPTMSNEPLREGDSVRLKGQTPVGTLLQLRNKQAVVAFGMIKTTAPLHRLEKVSDAAEEE